MSHRPYLIGVSGGSASGKTTLLDALRIAFREEELTLVSQDNYYRPLEDQKTDENGLVNFDHPDAIDFDRMLEHVKLLMSGQEVTLLEYTFNSDKIEPKLITYRPAPIILFEGIFVFYEQRLSRQLDLRVFVEADEHIKLSRRIRRDTAVRGFTLDSVLELYELHVIPMYRRFVEPYRAEADLVLNNNRHMQTAIDVLVHHLRAVLQERRQTA